MLIATHQPTSTYRGGRHLKTACLVAFIETVACWLMSMPRRSPLETRAHAAEVVPLNPSGQQVTAVHLVPRLPDAPPQRHGLALDRPRSPRPMFGANADGPARPATMRERLLVLDTQLSLILHDTWRSDLAQSKGLIGLSIAGAGGDDFLALLLPSLAPDTSTSDLKRQNPLIFRLQNTAFITLVRERASGILNRPTDTLEVFLIFPADRWADVAAAAVQRSQHDGVPLGPGTTVLCELVHGGAIRVVDIQRSSSVLTQSRFVPSSF